MCIKELNMAKLVCFKLFVVPISATLLKPDNEFTNAEKYYTESQALAEKNELDYLANKAFNLLTELYQKEKEPVDEVEIDLDEIKKEIGNSIGNTLSKYFKYATELSS